MHRARRAATRLFASLWVPALLVACAAPPRQVVAPPAAPERIIRVGTSPDAPPITFMQDGRIDVIMSGMSVTPARQVRVAFSDPYLRSGLLAATARAQAGKYGSRDAILNTGANVGVRMGSTAEGWAQSNLRYGNVVPYPSIEDAARELSQGRIDLIVSDAPQTAWAVSSFGATLKVLPIRLTQEDIAWGFRPQDAQLRQAANTALAGMRQDGRLRGILKRWIPFLDQLERLR
jgi:ABC-type amino acid transport substrate-binding protein